jgi:hypothetical protein
VQGAAAKFASNHSHDAASHGAALAGLRPAIALPWIC